MPLAESKVNRRQRIFLKGLINERSSHRFFWLSQSPQALLAGSHYSFALDCIGTCFRVSNRDSNRDVHDFLRSPALPVLNNFFRNFFGQNFVTAIIDVATRINVDRFFSLLEYVNQTKYLNLVTDKTLPCLF